MTQPSPNTTSTLASHLQPILPFLSNQASIKRTQGGQ